jgi:DNA modification methylase
MLPRPYYEDEAVTIYHGDCRELLPLMPTVDLVLTDPPYGIGEARGKNITRGVIANPRDYGVASWDDAPIDAVTINAMRGLGKSQIIFGGNYYELPPTSCWLLWDKLNGANDFADAEMAWTNLKSAVRVFRFRWSGMLRDGEPIVRTHPTQKPVELMRWCISKVPVAQSILDPFMGSGTTLRAAKDLGRKAIGIELEERYCEIAAKRMAQTVMAL